MAKSKTRKSPTLNGNKRSVEGNVVHIKDSQVTEKKLVSRYNAFQRRVCKIIKVTPADSYQYCFRFQYYGNTRLKVNDLVINSEKIIFMIIKESNGLAMMVPSKAYINKPKVYGNLTIVDRKKIK